VTLDDLREFGAARLSAYKLPRELIVRDIPRNPSGKILKHILRAELDSLAQESRLTHR
jgi:acyl-CoA synthetase (AMP-forming)/AMP-acid ligase II